MGSVVALQEKKILLGVTGSIAAYKAAFLTRLLIQAGAEVKVLMTSAAAKFISPLTLSTLSRHPVFTEVAGAEGWNNHVELGLWADAMVVAPLTASTLGKMAHGICDNMIVAAYLSARCPVFFAPAMDVDMWHHPTTQKNIKRLQSFGNQLIPVESGELASGLNGKGRMAEPETIVGILDHYFSSDLPLNGKKVLLTAGPTYEAIDPVRFIGNRSSGKMGIALAERAAALGAEVDLILGPSRLSPKNATIRVHPVESAQEMYETATRLFPQVDIAIMAAAVSDYRPAEYQDQKMKKQGSAPEIKLVENPDIAASLGQQKNRDQIIVGFALETKDAMANARKKLKKKNLDLIVLNSLEDAGAGFNHDTNRITIIDQNNNYTNFELKSKTAVAEDVWSAIIDLTANRP